PQHQHLSSSPQQQQHHQNRRMFSQLQARRRRRSHRLLHLALQARWRRSSRKTWRGTRGKGALVSGSTWGRKSRESR
ncbi:hypothetical protein KEM55_003577, partial [Ascosphaera atra]